MLFVRGGRRRHPAIFLEEREHVGVAIQPAHGAELLVETVTCLRARPDHTGLAQEGEQGAGRAGSVPVLAVLSHGIEQLVELLGIETARIWRNEVAEIGLRVSKAARSTVPVDGSRSKVKHGGSGNGLFQLSVGQADNQLEQRWAELRDR